MHTSRIPPMFSFYLFICFVWVLCSTVSCNERRCRLVGRRSIVSYRILRSSRRKGGREGVSEPLEGLGIWTMILYDTPGPDCDGCFSCLTTYHITSAVADLGSLDYSYSGYRRGLFFLKCTFLSNIFFSFAHRWFIAVTDIIAIYRYRAPVTGSLALGVRITASRVTAIAPHCA